MGGIHNPQRLTINFVTGEVEIHNYEYPDVVTVDSTIFEQAVKAYGGGEEGRKAVLGENGEYAYRWRQESDGSYRTYAGNTYHTLEFFYLERGGHRSNMQIRYNFVSTYDLTSHKSLHRDEAHGDMPLKENDFRFKLTAFPEDGMPPLMPTDPTDRDVIWIPNYLTKNSEGHWVPSEGAESLEEYTLIAGNSMDGNINFGYIIKAPSLELLPYVGKTFRYMIEELPPEGAVKNDDGTFMYNGGTVFPDENGAYIFDGIRYDPRIYYFKGTISKEGWISKKYYSDPDYQTLATDVVFANFDNYFDGRAMAVLKASKSLVNDGGEAMTIEADRFTFRLTDVTDPDNPSVIQASRGCGASGLIEFDPMEYTADADLPDGGMRTYIYMIEENVPEAPDPNIEYSEEKYYAAVTLSTDGESLLVNVKYYAAYPSQSAEAVSEDSVIFTNTCHTVQIGAKKIWADGNNAEDTRPDDLTVTLSNGDSYVLSDENGWSVTVKDLPKYNADKKEIIYIWTEEDTPGYASSGIWENGVFVFTNTLTTDISVRKLWDDNDDSEGKRPDSVTVLLLMNGEVIREVSLTSDRGWTYTEEGLAKYSGSEEIEYTWKEDQGSLPEGYRALEPYEDDDGVTVIVNRLEEKPPVTGYTGRLPLLAALMYLCLVCCASAVSSARRKKS